MSHFSTITDQSNTSNTGLLYDKIQSLNNMDINDSSFEDSLFEGFEIFLNTYKVYLETNTYPGNLEEFKYITKSFMGYIHKMWIEEDKDGKKVEDELEGEELDNYINVKDALEYIISNIDNIKTFTEFDDTEMKENVEIVNEFFKKSLEIQKEMNLMMESMNDKLETLANSLEQYVEANKDTREQ
jgi:hypothetical protein